MKNKTFILFGLTHELLR